MRLRLEPTSRGVYMSAETPPRLSVRGPLEVRGSNPSLTKKPLPKELYAI